jgi:hypothetical protein
MGTDIHLVIERKVKDKWIGIYASNAGYYANLRAEHRDYQFFGALANVRAVGPEPKGWPSDVSDLTHLIFSDVGKEGHSHSYYSAKEFCNIYNKIRKSEGGKKMSSYNILQIWPEDLKKYRVLFYFDN